MVTVNEAKQLIIANAALLPAETRKLSRSTGYVLAENIIAPLSLPSFRQSSMDGYAILHSDITSPQTVLKVAGESKAGQSDLEKLQPGTAMRIFTGAPVPEGASAVVMQEHTRLENGNVLIDEFPVPEGKNVRKIGQQIMAGSVALTAGTYLSPGSIGFLQGLGIQDVVVYPKPKVGFLITGDELLQPGSRMEPGKIFESNSGMIAAALEQEGLGEVEIRYAADTLDATIAALQLLVEKNDIVLASGGISVGDYDFVGEAMEAVGAETIFYKVRQKPGKPLLFGKKDQKLFFALPGNPASSLVCYYEYVLPAIRRMTGRTDIFLKALQLPVKYGYSFDGDRDEFLKASIAGDYVIALDGQESFSIRSFALADAIIYLPVSQNKVAAGDLVEVHLLPF
ncbi:gephyrin-like molybdotransferase Glp [Dyadobacter sp. Leaf189]|uniref:molybdopterin molybdotransferase MoeA n=1 Tax=Dyadobacter sp. Leaf189 TaxID=1736295 RepID=UPI00070169A8|nr:gephyrin-like molybdotransferase Glp [Dyadobacter sp. Leaf189]KQS24706.1 molybdenum cofactor biosynthesis protein [Dyadobacter sp. Leaf189]